MNELENIVRQKEWGGGSLGVEPYSKCPFSNNQYQQRIQFLGYHISVDAVIRDNIQHAK